MKTWSYGVNSIYKKAGIYLEEASWWVFVVDKIVESLCDFMPSIPLPNIEIRLKDKEDIEFNGRAEARDPVVFTLDLSGSCFF